MEQNAEMKRVQFKQRKAAKKAYNCSTIAIFPAKTVYNLPQFEWIYQ